MLRNYVLEVYYGLSFFCQNQTSLCSGVFHYIKKSRLGGACRQLDSVASCLYTGNIVLVLILGL